MILQGRKGGGGGQQVTRTPDTLKSEDTVEILFGLSEGPIKGLVDTEHPDRSFYIGDTPIEGPTGLRNFEGLVVQQYAGDPASPEVVRMGLGGMAENTAVNVALATGTYVNRTTSTGQIDAVDIRLRFDQLVVQNDSGTFENTADLTVQYRAQGTSLWLNAFLPAEGTTDRIRIKGKTTKAYVKEFRIPVERSATPFELRVAKWNDDLSTSEYCAVTWESFQTIINEPRTYPGTAMIRFAGKSSDQFSSIPRFSGIYDGRILQVPTTYNPEARTYDVGVWGGTFKMAWTNNPVWVLYDLIMNPRYGCARYYPNISVDLVSFYEASKYCDEAVSDGLGGTRPRFTFNDTLQEARSGKEQLLYVAGSFNAVIYDDDNGKVFIRVDKDESAVALFTPENVTEDGFSYSFTDVDTRYNKVTVAFRNPERNWEEDRRVILDQESIDARGEVPLEFIAVGCRSEAEALAKAKYKLLTALTETTNVTFQTTRIGFFVQPYDVILVADPTMQWATTGRFKSVAGNVVTLRDPIYFETTGTYTLKVQTATGVRQMTVDVPAVGNQTTLTRTSGDSLSGVPAKAVFSLEAVSGFGLPRPFRVMSIEPADGSEDLFSITAIEINRSKYGVVDDIELADAAIVSGLGTVLDPPTALTAEVVYQQDSAGLVMAVRLNWDASNSTGARGYQVQYSRNGELYQDAGTTTDTELLIPGVLSGSYSFRVRALGLLGRQSLPAYLDYTVDDTGVVNLTSITALTVDPSGTEFTGQNAAIRWTTNSVSALSGVEGTPAGSIFLEPSLKDFQVEVLTTGDVLLRTEYVSAPSYTYSIEKNVADGGPRRSFKVRVCVRDVRGNVGPKTTVTISNPVPAAVSGLSLTAGLGQAILGWNAPAELDYRGTLIWVSPTSGFSPGGVAATYDTQSTLAVVTIPEGAPAISVSPTMTALARRA